MVENYCNVARHLFLQPLRTDELIVEIDGPVLLALQLSLLESMGHELIARLVRVL
jgi:hypothetical protein